MLKWLYRFMIELTNHAVSSKFIAFFTKSRLSAWLIPSYAKIYRINQEEMEKSLNHYKTLQQLFIRKLKEGARPIDEAEDSIISPVDAVIEDIGIISEQKDITVKGKQYSIPEMLGSDALAEKYLNGLFVILYLSPSHYHRIHSPISGVVTRQWSLGAKSYPVNRLGLKYGRRPLSKNYRMITEVNSDGKHVAIVKVGAMFVNSIELTHPHDQLIKGQEMAYFSFGSTVVLLFEKDSVEIDSRMTVPMAIKVGERIGFWK
ncbi:Phosphatidylserine decarboxylase proenzyme [Anoxybacillus sp. P3H1B]|uniref:Phosphatidylserine decarboxylase proenzyme n=1 Tax=Anoxybacteroides rupiense TaxID=311460 RepID=A0ABD5IT30_9BACL|nr:MULTISPECIES: phosphatidylserine decarboxylase [Anoxybacillus]KXG11359.1 Phosphatidylserine decarboxylase proenzyme [Anoxybacillus sp. P3H1B]MBB3906937.1 phosphatidylserine decarboxylase [Anoxybacillus rupiensis]MBS2769953.1 phosphatidylserine decarboxylase [Anoxybacillus rupiensis]MED5050920.1 phosphatidylserine decarboxylase [Anoxybacillus rupiensis]